MAQIDPVVIERLLLAQLATVEVVPAGGAPNAGLTPVRVLGAAEREPKGSVGWGVVVRLARVEMTPMGRRLGSDEPDAESVTAAVTVKIDEKTARTDANALMKVLTAVKQALSEVRLEEVNTTHSVTLQRASVKQNPFSDEQRRIRTGVVLVTGVAQRQTGTYCETMV